MHDQGALRRRRGRLALAGGLLAASCIGPALAQNTVVFSTPGSTTWTAPPGVTSVSVRAWGGGGSGGTRTGTAAGGGGGGAYAANPAIAVVPGSSYTVTVGAGGAAVTTPATSGQAGGTSSFPSVIAAGGAGGNTSGVGGPGGTVAASAGTTRFAGGAGGAGQSGTGPVKGGGGGGGSARPTANGSAGSAGSGGVGGAGGAGQGAGGSGGGGTATLAAGTAPGGGGGAPADGVTPSAAGAPGRVEIDYRFNQVISFDPAPSVSVGGTGTVNATGGGSGNPVTYSSTTTTICSFDPATRVVTGVAAGNCVINANQAGSSTHNAAPQASQTIVISRSNQTISFGAQPEQTFLPSNGTFPLNPAATASSGLAVSYTSSTTAVCTVGSATTPTITIRGAGTCTITASQAGNANFNAATSVVRDITINRATQVLTFNAQTTTSRFLSGSTFAISPVATSNAGLAITYSSLNTSVCTVSGTTVTMVGPGICRLAANQTTGNANYTAAAQVTQDVSIVPSFVINAATVNGSSSTTLAQGLQLDISVDVSVAAGVALRGMRWVAAQSPPATISGYSCENTTDTAATNGNYSVSFVGYAPATAGTYNLYLIAYSADNCAAGSGNFYSPVFVLPGAVTVVDVPPMAQYRADECFWTGATRQVPDTSGFGRNGTLVGVVGNVDGGVINRALSIPLNTAAAQQQALDTGVSVNSIGSAGTIAFWYRSNTAWVGGGERLLFDASRYDSGPITLGKYFALVLRNNGTLGFGFEDTSDADFTLSTGVNNFAAGEWVHIAVTWSYLRDRMEITVNGTQTAVFTGTLGPLPPLNTIYIGDNRSTVYTAGGSPRSANGSFDEILLFASTLSTAQLGAIRNNHLAGQRWDGAPTAPLICIDHYELALPDSSLSCLPTTATVTACADASSPCTNPFTGANGATAVLSTSAGSLASTTLTFNASGVASTTLSHPGAADGAVVTVSLSGESIVANSGRQCCVDGSSCSAANSCASVFRTAGFVIAASAGGGAATLPAQTAGAASATYFLRAVRTGTSTQACEGALSGPNTVNWAAQCNNPGTCSSGNRMTLTGSSAVAIAGNPNTAVASFTSVPMTFDANGNAPFSFNYADVGQVTLHASKAAGGTLLSALAGSSNPFVVRPGGFVVSNIRQTASPGTTNPAAAGAAGARFIAAGESFGVTVTATTSGGATTPNFGRETSPEGVLLTHALVQPAGGAAGALANATIPGGSFSGGVATVSNLSFSEVGIITLTPAVADGDYLGAGGVSGTPSVNVGRFVPARFALSATATTHRSALSCSPASSFSYLGENFRLGLTLTAQNSAGGTTQNYTGAFAKLDPASAGAWNLVGRDGSTVFSTASGRLSLGTASGSWSNGVASGVTLTANAGRAGTPDGPFNAAFGVAPVDSDGVAMASFDMASSAGGSADRSTVATLPLRFGRLRLSNAIGPADRPLALPVAVQHWTGSSFDTHTQDSCTTLPANALSFGNLRRGLTVADTAAAGSVTLAAGVGTLRLAAPLAGRSGTYDVALSLGGAADASCLQPWTPGLGDAATSGAGLDYLRGAWCGSAYDDDPAARATFGLGRGVDALVYRRENY